MSWSCVACSVPDLTIFILLEHSEAESEPFFIGMDLQCPVRNQYYAILIDCFECHSHTFDRFFLLLFLFSFAFICG